MKSPVAEDQCVFIVALAPDSSYPSQEVEGRSPAWEGLLTQLGLGVPAWMASSTVAFSNGATVPWHVGCLSTWRGCFSVSFHGLCPADSFLLLSFVIMEYFASECAAQSGREIESLPP